MPRQVGQQLVEFSVSTHGGIRTKDCKLQAPAQLATEPKAMKQVQILSRIRKHKDRLAASMMMYEL